MARPYELVEAVRRALEDSSAFPNSVNFLEQQADVRGADANIKLPVCEIQTIGNIRLDPFNTDQVRVIEDSNGNHVGRVYHSEYNLNLQIDLWVAEQSSHDTDALGANLRDVLYLYDTAGPGEKLEDEDGQPIESVWRFRLGDGERRDDLTMTPTVRRWRQELSLWSYEEFETTADYITTVNYPSDLVDSDDDGQLTG